MRFQSLVNTTTAYGLLRLLVGSMNIRKLFGLFQYHSASVTSKLLANHEIRKRKDVCYGFDNCHLYLKQHFVLFEVVLMHRDPDGTVDFSPHAVYFSCFVCAIGTCPCSVYKDSHYVIIFLNKCCIKKSILQILNKEIN